MSIVLGFNSNSNGLWISIANCQTKAPQISGIINFNDWDEIELTLLIKKWFEKKSNCYNN
jgi:hypothetical protein